MALPRMRSILSISDRPVMGAQTESDRVKFTSGLVPLVFRILDSIHTDNC